jgi:hypothetical protein
MAGSVQGIEHGEGRACRQHGHDGHDEVDAAVGEDHDHIAALYAALHKVVGQYRRGLEDVLVCEGALRRRARGRLYDAWAVGVLARIAGEYLVDGALEVRPVKVCRRVGDVCLLRGAHDCAWRGYGVSMALSAGSRWLCACVYRS